MTASRLGVWEHWTGHQHIGYPVSEHSTILCQRSGTSAQAPSVNPADDARLDKERRMAEADVNSSDKESIFSINFL